MRVENLIREIRESKNISIVELAKMTKLSKGHISKIERGEIRPTIDTLVIIALALKVDVSELYKIYY